LPSGLGAAAARLAGTVGDTIAGMIVSDLANYLAPIFLKAVFGIPTREEALQAEVEALAGDMSWRLQAAENDYRQTHQLCSGSEPEQLYYNISFRAGYKQSIYTRGNQPSGVFAEMVGVSVSPYPINTTVDSSRADLAGGGHAVIFVQQAQTITYSVPANIHQ